MNKVSRKIKPKSKLQTLPLGKITASGWIKRQLEIEANGLSGHMDELEPNLLLEPFISRKHEDKLDELITKGMAAAWSAEMSGAYWTGLVQLAFTLNDEELKEKAEKWVNAVLANQEEDGYIGAYKKTDDRYNDYNAWGTNWGLRALLSYYEAAGREDVLEACHKGLLWFVREWRGNKKTYYAGPAIIESMVVVYLYTGDESLLNWTEQYMDWLDENSILSNNIKCFSSDELYYNSMHAVAYGEDVKLPAILYSCNGNENYLAASINGINKVLRKCFQRTGAPSSNLEYLSPAGSVCETEYCNFATYSDTFKWMAVITGDSNYGDLIEKIVFNGSQGGKKKDGRAMAYYSTPNQIYATEQSSAFSGGGQVYASVYKTACCPTQSVRVMPEYVRGMCMQGMENDLYFMCYGPCNINVAAADGETVEIEEVTEYPFKEEIKLIFKTDEPAHLKINLRIPGWCDNASIMLNGKEIDGQKLGGTYFSIDRVWNGGDSVKIDFFMKVNIVRVNDADFSNKKPLAIERGPLLFSLPIKEKWLTVPSESFTPHDDWPWYNVIPADFDPGSSDIFDGVVPLVPWSYALCKEILDEAKNIEIIYIDTKGEYQWARSPVIIKVPARKFRYYQNYNTSKNLEIYENPVHTDEPQETIELIPYGCTNLRISYFPEYKKCSY